MASRKRLKEQSDRSKSFKDVVFVITLEDGNTVDWTMPVHKTINEKTQGNNAVRQYNKTHAVKAIYAYVD